MNSVELGQAVYLQKDDKDSVGGWGIQSIPKYCVKEFEELKVKYGKRNLYKEVLEVAIEFIENKIFSIQ